MSEWKECKLGDVLEIKYGKDHKLLPDGNIPVYGSGGIMRYVDKWIYNEESILIPRKGSLNNIFYMNEPFWTVDTIFWSKINNTKTFPKFLFYQLSVIDYANLNVGSAVPSLTVPVINAIDILLPPLPEQKAIAAVLSSLDDKIDLLHRQNKTLEAMAETLFRQWFVEEADEEWEEVPIYNCGQFINGSAFRDKDFDNYIGALPIVKIAEIKNGISSQTKYTSKEMPEKYYIQDEEILFSWSGTPETSLGIFIWMGGHAVLNQHIFRVVPIDESEKYWLYYLLKFCMGEFIQFATYKQTIGLGHVTVADLKSLMIKKPKLSEIVERSKELQPIFKKTVINHKQICALEKLRDTLLPKLMSGEVRVKI